MNEDYIKELEKIEKEMLKLNERKQNILNEERKSKETEKNRRYKEIENAYNKFVDLLEAYENDYNEGFSIKFSGEILNN